MSLNLDHASDGLNSTKVANSPEPETAASESPLLAGDAKYRGLFEATPVSLWEEDFSAVKKYIEQLREQGVTNFRAYFDAHPEEVFHCIGLIKVKDVNQATLELFKAQSKEELLSNLDIIFGPDVFELFKEELILIEQGKTSFEYEGINYTLENEKIDVLVRWSVSPGFEESFSQIIVSIIDISSKKKVAEQLHLQAAALEAAANAILITDENGDILWVNPAFTKLTGYALEEVLGKNPRILKSGKNSPELYADLWETIKAGKVWHSRELINRRKDGSFYFEQMTIAPVIGSDYNFTRYVAIKEDISERMEMELRLRQQLREEELLRKVMALAASNFDFTRILTELCRELAGFFQVPKSAVALLNAERTEAKVVTEYCEAGYPSSMGVTIPVSGNPSMEYLLKQKKPLAIEDVQHESLTRPVHDTLRQLGIVSMLVIPVMAGGNVMGTIGFDSFTPRRFSAQDVRVGIKVAAHISLTLQRQQAEKAVERERDFAQQIMKSMGQGLVVLSPRLTVEYCNPAFAALLGHGEEELIGRSMIELVQLNTQKPIKFPDAALRDAKQIVREINFAHADGGQISALVTAVPQGDAIEEEGAICVVTDLSAQKKIEQALAEARDRALEASRLKSEFLANMSHEIRTPLNAIIGMTSLMLDSPLTEEQQDNARTIRSSSDVLLSLINDILDFSKIEAGKLTLEKRPFSVRDCVEGAFDVLVTKASEKGLELVYVIEESVPNEILGDVTRLRQVLVNLLNNAIKFTESGEVLLYVTPTEAEITNEADKEMTLHFAVQDTGIGILPEKLDLLFKSFSQVDASTTRKYGGTGLGLAISKQLVDMMGGQIWVESAYRNGSTFHFTIATAAVTSGQRDPGREAPPQLEGKRILIVDDNKTNCKILMKQVDSWGMVPRAVNSGAEALRLLQQGKLFDLAILDMQMPEMDGLMLAGEIRKLFNRRALPLVLLSSNGDDGDLDDAESFSAVLTKPVKQQALFETLADVFAETAVRAVRTAQLLTVDPDMGHNHPLRILLAEDNLVNQKVALRLLERLGYRADVAGDGQEVLAALNQRRYDVVLMDVQMPKMDGVEATQQIRRSWSTAEQPEIIAMTAHALTGDREKYLAAGMDNYISKPVRIQELMQALAGVQPLFES